MVLGWTTETWNRALKWAGDTETLVSLEPEHFRRLLDVRRKWDMAGGPDSGPVSGLVLGGK